MPAMGRTTDPVLTALEGIVAALESNIEVSRAAIERARLIAELRFQGLAYREIADETGRPLVVEMISENLNRLRTSGAALRRAQAAALHDEGLTMEQIADLFGVTRQRISTILRGDG